MGAFVGMMRRRLSTGASGSLDHRHTPTHGEVMASRIGTSLTQQALQYAFDARPFTMAEAALHGVTRRRVQCAVEAGKVTHLRRGLYVASCATPRDRLLALQQQLGGREVAAISGCRSAADVWGLPVLGVHGPLPESLPSIWVPPGTARPGVRGGVHYLVGEVPRDHVVALPDGLVVTTPLRTAVDVVRLARLPRRLALATIVGGMRAHVAYAAGIDLRDAGAITALMQDAEQREAVREELRTVADASPAWGMTSVRACVSVADPRLENALESISFGRFLDAGVRLPRPQAWLPGASGRLWRVDFWWEELGIVGEADGMVKYADRQVLIDEKGRQLDLEGPGRSVHRWGWGNALRHDDPLMAQLLSRLR